MIATLGVWKKKKRKKEKKKIFPVETPFPSGESFKIRIGFDWEGLKRCFKQDQPQRCGFFQSKNEETILNFS